MMTYLTLSYSHCVLVYITTVPPPSSLIANIRQRHFKCLFETTIPTKDVYIPRGLLSCVCVLQSVCMYILYALHITICIPFSHQPTEKENQQTKSKSSEFNISCHSRVENEMFHFECK